jgi:excisionase family DNA binding protein
MDELLTTEQAAAILQLTPKTIKDWLRAGKLTGCKMGRLWRVREADLETFIQASRMLSVREENAESHQER